MSKHTPGPWRVIKDRFNNSQVYAKNKNILDDLPVADHIIDEANARLIAAAPKMFHAIEAFLARSSGHGCPDNEIEDCDLCCTRQEMKAAISKVEAKP